MPLVVYDFLLFGINMERVNLSNSTNLSRIIYGMWRLADDTNISIKPPSAKKYWVIK